MVEGDTWKGEAGDLAAVAVLGTDNMNAVYGGVDVMTEDLFVQKGAKEGAAVSFGDNDRATSSNVKSGGVTPRTPQTTAPDPQSDRDPSGGAVSAGVANTPTGGAGGASAGPSYSQAARAAAPTGSAALSAESQKPGMQQDPISPTRPAGNPGTTSSPARASQMRVQDPKATHEIPTKGCFLRYAPDALGTLFLHWVDGGLSGRKELPAGALAWFEPGKSVAKFKFSTNGGRQELKKGVDAKEKLFEGWAQFLKEAVYGFHAVKILMLDYNVHEAHN